MIAQSHQRQLPTLLRTLTRFYVIQIICILDVHKNSIRRLKLLIVDYDSTVATM